MSNLGKNLFLLKGWGVNSAYPPLIFDCDGVLVDSEAICIGVELDLLASIGARYEWAEYVHTFMGLAPERWHAELADDVEARTGRRPPPSFFDELEEALERVMREQLRPLPDAREAVASVTGPRAVASSTPQPSLGWKLTHTGLADLFGPHVYSADAVARGKPAPDLFLHAADGLGVDPRDCVVIEDSANGVRAAVAAGMTAVGFTGGGHCGDGHGAMLRNAGAAMIVDSLSAAATAIPGRPGGTP